MSIKKISLFILLIGSITMSHAEKNTMYYMQMKAHLIYCEARLNGMYLFNTLQQTKYIPELITMGQQISEYMDAGKNIFTLNAENVAQDLRPEEMATGYCELTITAQTYNAETNVQEESKVISHIKVTYKKKDNRSENPEYELVAEKSAKIDDQSTQDVIFVNSTPETEKSYSSKTYGQEVNSVAEAYPFQWIHRSTPIRDTQENREKAWDAYMEIKEAIVRRDRATIKNIAKIGATDVANYQKDDVNNHFDIVFSQLLQDYFEFDPEVWEYQRIGLDGFDLEIYAGGKLFRLVKKKAYIASPLSWRNKYTKMYRSYNPLFTMIDGKVVMATF